MQITIVKPRNEKLKEYIQYFLFMRKDNRNAINYTTFPNSNLCLAIYQENSIHYLKERNANHCLISAGGSALSSKIYGFHTMPFEVDVSCELDQVCILFHPAGLRAFTNIPYAEILSSDRPFDEIFGLANRWKLEHMFELKDATARARILEELLWVHLNNGISQKFNEVLHHIALISLEELNVGLLCKKLLLSESTLSRLFTGHLGQNPQAYFKTLRFRKVLGEVLHKSSSMTSIGYANAYYDQAHFIKDFKSLTGFTPKKILREISVQQNDLTWVYKKRPD